MNMIVKLSSVKDNFLVETLLGIICVVVFPVLLKEFIVKPVLQLLPINDVFRTTIQHSISLVMILIAYFLFVKFYENSEVPELATGILRYNLYGFIFAFSSISLVIGSIAALGYYQIITINWNFNFIGTLILIYTLATVEELIFRGFLYRLGEKKIGTNYAIILSAVIFGLMHFFNDDVNLFGIISATFGGLLMTILYAYRKNLWLPISSHAFWNYSQVIYGSNVSGIDFGAFINAKISGPAIFVGREGIGFGIEESIFVLLIVILPFLAIYYKMYKSDGLVANPRKKKNIKTIIGNSEILL